MASDEREWIDGTQWHFVKEELGAPFTCRRCRGHGKHAVVLVDDKGNKIRVGLTCEERLGVRR
jgi:hypothetical protein